MITDLSHQPYELEIKVEETDIDQMGHVNNVVYLRWVQNVAVAHWNVAATEEEKRNILWVIIRHEIDYKRPAFMNDIILARTWIGKANRRSFERHTEFYRKGNKKLLAKTLTFWCPISSITKKPIEPGKELYRRFSTNIQ